MIILILMIIENAVIDALTYPILSILGFADDVDALAVVDQELETLGESLDMSCSRYKIEIALRSPN